MPIKSHRNHSFHLSFRKLFEKEDLWLWIPILALVIIGVLFIYSGSLTINGTPHHGGFPLFAKQLIWIAVGFLAALCFILLPFRNYSVWIYYSQILFYLLMILPVFLPSRSGHSWIRLGPLSLQPSELFKPFYVVILSIVYTRYQPYFHKVWGFLLLSAFSSLPILITVLQHDMGSASVYIPICIAMMLHAGADKKIIGSLLAGFFLLYLFTLIGSLAYYHHQPSFLALFLIHPIAKTVVSIACAVVLFMALLGFFIYKKRFFLKFSVVFALFLFAYLFSFLTVPTEKGFGILGEYQIERMVYPIDPSLNLRTHYNIEQAKIAIGSGGVIGKGFLKGNLSHRQFVPEQPTDFIFSILGEEWGWLGSMFVLILYFILLARILWISLKIQELQPSLVVIGLFWIFFYHVLINIGMNLGLVPVIGIPLLFLSYGGSSVIMSFISIGMLLHLYRNR